MKDEINENIKPPTVEYVKMPSLHMVYLSQALAILLIFLLIIFIFK